MAATTVTVIIPTLNEEVVIAAAIDRAWQATADEVIVVDGGSRDETVAIAGAARCRLLIAPPGRAVQQNEGARRAVGAVLLFLHADCWLDPGAIEQVRRALGDPKILGGAFHQRIDADGWAYRLLEHGNAWRVRWRGLPYGDQGIFMRREVFQRLGGFPPVPLMEDLLLMRRLRRLARPVLLPGPLHVSPRRWQRRGVLRQTLRNWCLLTAHGLGVSPQRLAQYYPPDR